MSGENVAVVRGAIAAYVSGDNAGALAAYDSDVEFDATVRPDGRVYRGRLGVAEAMRVWTGAWDDYSLDAEEIVDAGDRVLVIARESGRGKGSGVGIDQMVFSVFTLRNGKITRQAVFLDRDQAFAAAGLSE